MAKELILNFVDTYFKQLNFYTHTMKRIKNTVLIFLTTLISTTVFGQSKLFKLTVKFSKPIPSSIVFLKHIDVKSGKSVIDSASITNGLAEFSDSTLYPQKAILFSALKNSGFDFNNATDRLFIYLESGHIIVSAVDAIKTASISGTRINNDAQAFADLRQEFQKKKAELFKRFREKDTSDIL